VPLEPQKAGKQARPSQRYLRHSGRVAIEELRPRSMWHAPLPTSSPTAGPVVEAESDPKAPDIPARLSRATLHPRTDPFDGVALMPAPHCKACCPDQCLPLADLNPAKLWRRGNALGISRLTRRPHAALRF